MAKKGAVQQLQAELQTDEDFDKFLERPGLLVLDVYSEWCGPCLGMVGSLRKIKLEIGGDNLQLAICKSDTITALKRFNKKSEPTWLFVTNGKAVNIMFGSDVPKLVTLITRELEKTIQKIPRTTYEVSELQPIEVEHLRVKTEAVEKAERIEREAKNKKQTDYLTKVTDIIMDNIPDIGVTVFGPQVNRDMFKKLTEPAEPLKLQCKDRKVVQVSLEQFDIVNFACQNPLPPEVIEQLDGKELLMCFWKVDETVGSVPNVLMTYAHELTKERVSPVTDASDEEHIIPPIIAPMKLKFEVEIQDGEVWMDELSSEEEAARKKAAQKRKSGLQVQEDSHATPIIDEAQDDDVEEECSEEGAADGAEPPALPGVSFDMDLDLGDDMGEEEEEEKEEEPPKKLTRTKTVKLPAIWVPNNRRTHAALIYVFFRSQTSGFLAPDPKPEPPHIIMAFDASKRRDIINMVERHKDEVPLYGYFTTENPDDAKLISNSTTKYEYCDQTPNDKIVLKVNKVQSNMMLSLVSYGPCYVSPNVTIGRDEALKFFPEDYHVQEELPQVDEKKKPRKRSKKFEEPIYPEPEKSAAPAPAQVPAPAPVPAEPAPVEEAPVEGAEPAQPGEEPAEGADPTVQPAEAAPLEEDAAAAAQPDAAPPTESAEPAADAAAATTEAPPETIEPPAEAEAAEEAAPAEAAPPPPPAE